MSIIIAAIDHTGKNLWVGSDRKVGTIEGTFLDTEMEKNFRISDTILFSGNGFTERVLDLAAQLTKNKSLPASQLIQMVDNFPVQTEEYNGKKYGCTFVLSGVHDDGQLFIYSIETKDRLNAFVKYQLGYIPLTVASPNDEAGAIAKEAFLDFLANTLDYKLSIGYAITLASKKCESIGSSINIEKVSI